MTRFHRSLLFVAPVVLSLLSACGGSSSSPSTPSTPPPTPTPAPVRTVLIQGSDTLGVMELGLLPFTTTAAGTLDVTVDWTFASNRIAVYLTQGNCSFDQFVAAQCQLLINSESATPKPKVFTVNSAAAGSYTLFVGNIGPTEESVAFQVSLTSARASAASSSVRGRFKTRASPDILAGKVGH